MLVYAEEIIHASRPEFFSVQAVGLSLMNKVQFIGSKISLNDLSASHAYH
jgi:hypothetical protein